MRFRKTNPGDLPQLKSLWALGFGDTEQEIGRFSPFPIPPRPASVQKRTARSLPPPTRCRRRWHGAKKTAARPIFMP